MMTRRQHLSPVPHEGESEQPKTAGFPVTIEIPTGGNATADCLIRELARVAFRGTLRGYEVKVDGPRVRCFVTVQPMSDFGQGEIQEAVRRIVSALASIGVVKLQPKPAEKATEDGSECPPSSQES